MERPRTVPRLWDVRLRLTVMGNANPLSSAVMGPNDDVELDDDVELVPVALANTMEFTPLSMCKKYTMVSGGSPTFVDEDAPLTIQMFGRLDRSIMTMKKIVVNAIFLKLWCKTQMQKEESVVCACACFE